MIDIRSSWLVIDGQVMRVGEQPKGVYHCGTCGVRGHSARTCGREPKR